MDKVENEFLEGCEIIPEVTEIISNQAAPGVSTAKANDVYSPFGVLLL